MTTVQDQILRSSTVRLDKSIRLLFCCWPASWLTDWKALSWL